MITKSLSRAAILLSYLLAFGACSESDELSGDAATASSVDSAIEADSWESFAAGFFESYCGACHGAGDTLRVSGVL